MTTTEPQREVAGRRLSDRLRIDISFRKLVAAVTAGIIGSVTVLGATVKPAFDNLQKVPVIEVKIEQLRADVDKLQDINNKLDRLLMMAEQQEKK